VVDSGCDVAVDGPGGGKFDVVGELGGARVGRPGQGPGRARPRLTRCGHSQWTGRWWWQSKGWAMMMAESKE